MPARKKQKVRLNIRISEEKYKLLLKKAHRRFEDNLSSAIRAAIDIFLIEK